MKKLFNKEVEPTCEYCVHGKRSIDGQKILCLKKGVMPLQGSCRNYKYNPLHRIPKSKPKLPKYDPEEFKL